MNKPQPEQKTVSDSKLNMFRCMIVMAHADNVLDEKEKEYMYTLMKKSAFTPQQKQILEDDLENPKEIEDILPQVTKPEDRGQVVYFARLMACKDGVFDPSEEDLIDRLHANAMKNLDMDALREDVKRAVALNLQAQKELQEELSLKSSLFRAFDRWMQAIGLQ
ncbi:MAG: DUF533 domain-containing protein [Alphaproteobacteria bacterium]|nr:DUF533 domain-containing protein [Alphaproteobacteria bacterium]